MNVTLHDSMYMAYIARLQEFQVKFRQKLAKNREHLVSFEWLADKITPDLQDKRQLDTVHVMFNMIHAQYTVFIHNFSPEVVFCNFFATLCNLNFGSDYSLSNSDAHKT